MAWMSIIKHPGCFLEPLAVNIRYILYVFHVHADLCLKHMESPVESDLFFIDLVLHQWDPSRSRLCWEHSSLHHTEHRGHRDFGCHHLGEYCYFKSIKRVWFNTKAVRCLTFRLSSASFLILEYCQYCNWKRSVCPVCLDGTKHF